MTSTKPILKNKTRILRPNEWDQLLLGCEKIDQSTNLKVCLYTGMRYIELRRLQENPDWWDGHRFIHLPKEACRKKERTLEERWVRLPPRALEIMPYFLRDRDMPTRSGWNKNIIRWAKAAGMDPSGISAKTTRKTWESWLVYFYRDKANSTIQIFQSQGHNSITSIMHYLMMPFEETDRLAMKPFVEGWID